MDDLITRRLQALAQEYIEAMNAAVEENRDDLIARLVDEYPEAAAAIMYSETFDA